MQTNRDLLQELAQICYESLSDAYDQLNTLAFRDTVHRLVRVASETWDSAGPRSGKKTELSAYLTQEEISQMVVARREKSFNSHELPPQSGMVDYSHRGYLVLNLKALKDYSD